MTMVKARLICSLVALALVWASSGVLFTTLVSGVGLMQAWLVGGTVMFLIGWVVVGLPLVALGECASSVKHFPIIVFASGLGGALILFLPDLLIRMADWRHQYPWSRADLGWPAIGFGCAAATALLYCILLRTCDVVGVGPGEDEPRL